VTQEAAKQHRARAASQQASGASAARLKPHRQQAIGGDATHTGGRAIEASIKLMHCDGPPADSPWQQAKPSGSTRGDPGQRTRRGEDQIPPIAHLSLPTPRTPLDRPAWDRGAGREVVGKGASKEAESSTARVGQNQFILWRRQACRATRETQVIPEARGKAGTMRNHRANHRDGVLLARIGGVHQAIDAGQDAGPAERSGP